MKKSSAGKAALFAVLCPGLVFAAQLVVSAVPEAVDRYARDFDATMRSRGPIALESLYMEGLTAAEALLRRELVPARPSDAISYLESLDEPTLRKVRSLMPGFLVNREEVIVAEPLADFFLKLAREKGAAADQAYFEALKKTYPEGYWPVYMQQQTDYSGCRVFDGKTMTDLYGVWIAFQRAYPNQYREPARKELERIEEALGGDCACGGEDGVRSELENFLRTYPGSPPAAKLTARLQAVKNGTSGFRFHCTPR